MIEILKKINWVDILMLVLLVRIVYISAKTGFVTEFMKMLGALLACFFAFHYYVRIAAFMGDATKDMSEPVLQVCAFGVIWLVTFWIFHLVRNALVTVFTVQTMSLVDRWGAAVVSLARFFLTGSMIMFMFLMTDHSYVEKMMVSSYSQKYILGVAPKIYYTVTNGFVVKFFPGQKVNPAVIGELGKVRAR
ncbi:MAG: CvpA family protein [Candidatus Omnitrophica bacterium]|nr:CvpA family protein [Candidatus Omnitrophota bacterium]